MDQKNPNYHQSRLSYAATCALTRTKPLRTHPPAAEGRAQHQQQRPPPRAQVNPPLADGTGAKAARAPWAPPAAGKPRCRGAWLREGVPRSFPRPIDPSPPSNETRWRQLGSSRWAVKGAASSQAQRPVETMNGR